jgi:hypothetical protein
MVNRTFLANLAGRALAGIGLGLVGILLGYLLQYIGGRLFDLIAQCLPTESRFCEAIGFLPHFWRDKFRW